MYTQSTSIGSNPHAMKYIHKQHFLIKQSKVKHSQGSGVQHIVAFCLAHRAFGHIGNGMVDDDGNDKDESDDSAMKMARNKPILSRECMMVLGRAKELVAHRGELLFWATRAHSLNDFCVSVLLLYVEKVFVFFASHFRAYLCEHFCRGE